MIGIINKDSSFFEVTSDDIELDDKLMSRSLINFSVTEQRDAMTQGSLSFRDDNHIYSRILRTGVNIKVAWGYKDNIFGQNSLSTNLDEISGSLVRRGLKAFVSSPSGGGNVGGVTTYNCNFTAYNFRGLENSIVYSSGTRRDVIETVFNNIGVSKSKRYINFALGSDELGFERSVRQDETDFLFLTRLAREWGTIFTIGFSSNNEVVAVFMDPDQIGDTNMSRWMGGTSGSTHAIGYKGKISNVISYTWTSNESESGVGDNAQLDFVDGQVIVRRFIAEQEKVILYRLDPDKIQEALDEAGNDGFISQTALVKDLLNTKDFESIKHFFTPYESTTAPQGFGYKIKAKMIGNPLFVPPNKISINNGFPDRLGNAQSKWYIDKVSHRIDKSGYKMDTEIIDVFSLSDIGLGIL